MESISKYIHGTKQQIQAAYDHLRELNGQMRSWAFALDDIQEAKRPGALQRIAVLREAAMRVQRTWAVLQNNAVLWDVLNENIWEKTDECWQQASERSMAISRACARGGGDYRQFMAACKANIALKDLIDALQQALEVALGQAGGVSSRRQSSARHRGAPPRTSFHDG